MTNHLTETRDEIWTHFTNRWQGHTWINTSNTENSCSHTNKASGLILGYNIANISIHHHLFRVRRCTAGKVAKPSVMIHAEGRQIQEPHTSSLAVLVCQAYFTCIQLTPLSRRRTPLTTARHPEIQAEGAQLLISHTNSSATRSSPFMNITSEFQYPREPEIIQLTSSTLGDEKLKIAETGRRKEQSTMSHYPYFLLKLDN